MNCGTIFYHKKFQFPNNGIIIDKLIIVLCELGSDFLVVTTTSKQRNKSKNEGCQISETEPNYFIPQNVDWFNKDTWIELFNVYEINTFQFDIEFEDGEIDECHTLDSQVMKDILACAMQSDDIENYYLEFIEREFNKL